MGGGRGPLRSLSSRRCWPYPAQLRVTRLTCAAARHDRVPTSVEPVNASLRTSGWVMNRSHHTALAGRHLEQIGGGSRPRPLQFAERMLVNGVPFGGF